MNRQLTKLSLVALLICLFSGLAYAQEPSGYYKKAEGKCQKELLKQLCEIVGPHKNVGYDGLWNVYKDSDIRPGTNYYWDMYSTSKFREGQQKCGNYSHVGDCVNREHSFPKSWFKEGQPMVSDAFHIYPTDGKVNGQRSNFLMASVPTEQRCRRAMVWTLSENSESRHSRATRVRFSNRLTSIRATLPALISIWRLAITTKSLRGAVLCLPETAILATQPGL